MIKVYVAGKYSADNVIDVLKNIGKGQEACARLFGLGFSPFCPWHDKSYVIDRPWSCFSVEQFHKHSMEWLEVSDAVFLVEGWEDSYGTLKEIKRASELNIPIFEGIPDIIEWASSFCGHNYSSINNNKKEPSREGNGGSTPEQYSLPNNAKELQDLIEYRDMNGSMMNIFKACYRYGIKNNREYDLNKIIWFAQRELARIKGEACWQK